MSLFGVSTHQLAFDNRFDIGEAPGMLNLNGSLHGGGDVSSLAPHNHALASDPESGWVKSSLSFANSNCVEVANLPGGQVGVRHSRHAENGPVLRFTPGEWHAFLGGVRNGEFDAFGGQRGPAA